MKKLLIVGISFLTCISVVKADCDYARLIDLNTQASHVNYSYSFNEDSKLFDVTLINITNSLKLIYNGKTYSKSNNSVVLKGMEEGKYITIEIDSNDSLCPHEVLRFIYVAIPYINIYYNTKDCENYKNLTVCSSRFLNYKLTYSNLKNILNEYDKSKNVPNEEEKEEESDNTQTENVLTVIYDVAKKYWIEASLVIGSSLITYLLGNLIYKRVKYKL